MPIPLVAGIIGAAVLALLWLLFLPPFALLRADSGCQSVGDGYKACEIKKLPAPAPAGLAPATRDYEIRLRKDASPATSVALPLLDAKAGNRGLSFYSYQGGKWQRVAPADTSPDGTLAQGAVQNIPNNLIALKRQSGGFQIMGTLPAGKTLSPDAQKQITMLSPSGFAPASDGKVNGESPPAAPGAQYDVLPAVQAQSPAAATVVSQLLGAQDKQSAHITELAALANRPGNNGIELDYTAVAAPQRQAFTDFVAALAQELHKNHHLLVVEAPEPKISGNGWNTGAYDWTALAKSADYLKLLPDPDLSVYRKQLPDAIKYLTMQASVDPRKLMLVTSPYSVEKSDQGTQTLTRLSALSRASQIQIQNQDQAVAGANVNLVAANLNRETGGSGLVWDGNTATVSFVFRVGDATHVVWIENEFSEAFKLEYVQTFHLGGVSVEDASNDAALGNPWPAVAQFAATGAPLLLQPNPQLLAPTWLADGKPLDTGGKTVVTWPAPAQPGEHTISLIVGDGVIRVIGSTKLSLRATLPAGSTPGPGGVLGITATPRPAPPTAASPVRTPAAGAAPTATR